jgi:hypothetical protein
MSRTRSSMVSPGSAMTIRRPCADNADSRCSTPKRASRSRCSTTITLASGSDKTRRSLGRLPFSPDRPRTPPAPPPSRARWPRRQPSHLPIQIQALIMRRHPRRHHHTHRRIRPDSPDHNQPTHPLCGHRQPALPKPAVGSTPVHPNRFRPKPPDSQQQQNTLTNTQTHPTRNCSQP